MIASLLLHLGLGVLLVAAGRRLGRAAFLVAAVAPLTTLVWTAARLGGVLDGRPILAHVRWVAEIGLEIDLRLDAFGATMALLVAGIGVLVLVYAASYFPAGTPDVGRLAGLLVLFAGAMVGLVASDHLLALYGFWELTSVTSYLLIGNRHTDVAARSAALHALLVTAAGGLAMLGGFVVLGHAAGTYRLSELAAEPRPTGTAVGVALGLILLGAFAKSAQYPLHAWLPGAMAAPTPVSAYLHSATMVKAGVYLVARLAPVFAGTMLWRPTVLTVGVVTMVAGGLRALRQNDLKLLLAYGTVSQLGLLMVLFGAGSVATAEAGLVMLVAHAAFKAALFMVVGVLDQQTGTREIRELAPLGRRWRPLEIASGVGAASMAGVPLGLGFVGKEAMFESLRHDPFGGASLVLAAVVVGSVLTAAYAARFHLGAFVLPRRRSGAPAAGAAAAPSWAFVAPPLVLAAASLLGGVAPGLIGPLRAGAVDALHLQVAVADLAVWHGLTVPLALSAVVLAGGALVTRFDRHVQPVLATGGAVPSAEDAYLLSLRGLDEGSRRLTGVVQNGSLPVYAGVILATAAALPLAVLATSADDFHWPAIVGSAGTGPVVAVLTVAAIGAAVVRRRFSTAIFLSLAGYSMAGLFVLYGAPDLALTQVAVETLSTVLFVLVLRRLPDRFERQSSPRRRALRLAIAGLVGVTIFVFALAAAGSRTGTPVSTEMVARSLPDGHGRNVVNVILVDFRALDTLGEITVLAAASIGAVALARAIRGGSGPARRPRGVAPVGNPAPRVVFLDVSAQVIFHVVLMASVWLLLSGHNHPGGGFVAGLLAGSAIALRYTAGGIDEVRGLSRLAPWTVLGFGLLLAGFTALAPVVAGRPVLDVASRAVDLPLAGSVTFSSALAFDIGVYAVVIGMVLMVFEAFGDDTGPAAVDR